MMIIFEYAIAVSLNYEKFKKDPQKVSKIKTFNDKYNWKEISFSS